MSEYKVTVNIPCHNEEVDIERVVCSFKKELPDSEVIVYDNCSTDNTAIKALKAGAVVVDVPNKGKGNVVRRIFSETDADFYVVVDGDGTYDASAINGMINIMISKKLDMLVGSRIEVGSNAYRKGHRFGNKVLTYCASLIFGKSFKDMLSGYRIFSKRFAKSFSAHSEGFEIETELNIHALQMRLPVLEVETNYYARSEESSSKLRTYRDGWRILLTIINLFRHGKPLMFYSFAALFFMLLALSFGVPVILNFFETGMVKKLPTAVLSAALVMISSVLLACGLILDSIAMGRLEFKWQAYLNVKR